VRLVEVRLLEGPNLYRLEPTAKIEVAVGRRRTWYGARLPGAHAVVALGRPVRAREVPRTIRDLAAWVRRLHRLSGGAAWLGRETSPDGRPRRTLPITVHRTSEPGHWIVAFPWREHERARELADAAWRLTERGLDPRTVRVAKSPTLARALVRIRAAGATPPAWLTDDRRRIPIVSVSGTNGKSTTTRMIGAILRARGGGWA